MGSYLDKRAQAQHAFENPDSVLNKGPKPEFTSRHADPRHPASSGNLVSLVTGAHVNPPERGYWGRGGGRGLRWWEAGLLGRLAGKRW